MSMTIFASLLVAIIGLVTYFVASNPKLQEAGRIAYAAGLLATLLSVATHVIKL